MPGNPEAVPVARMGADQEQPGCLSRLLECCSRRGGGSVPTRVEMIIDSQASRSSIGASAGFAGGERGDPLNLESQAHRGSREARLDDALLVDPEGGGEYGAIAGRTVGDPALSRCQALRACCGRSPLFRSSTPVDVKRVQIIHAVFLVFGVIATLLLTGRSIEHHDSVYSEPNIGAQVAWGIGSFLVGGIIYTALVIGLLLFKLLPKQQLVGRVCPNVRLTLAAHLASIIPPVLTSIPQMTSHNFLYKKPPAPAPNPSAITVDRTVPENGFSAVCHRVPGTDSCQARIDTGAWLRQAARLFFHSGDINCTVENGTSVREGSQLVLTKESACDPSSAQTTGSFPVDCHMEPIVVDGMPVSGTDAVHISGTLQRHIDGKPSVIDAVDYRSKLPPNPSQNRPAGTIIASGPAKNGSCTQSLNGAALVLSGDRCTTTMDVSSTQTLTATTLSGGSCAGQSTPLNLPEAQAAAPEVVPTDPVSLGYRETCALVSGNTTACVGQGSPGDETGLSVTIDGVTKHYAYGTPAVVDCDTLRDGVVSMGAEASPAQTAFLVNGSKAQYALTDASPQMTAAQAGCPAPTGSPTQSPTQSPTHAPTQSPSAGPGKYTVDGSAGVIMTSQGRPVVPFRASGQTAGSAPVVGQHFEVTCNDGNLFDDTTYSGVTGPDGVDAFNITGSACTGAGTFAAPTCVGSNISVSAQPQNPAICTHQAVGVMDVTCTGVSMTSGGAIPEVTCVSNGIVSGSGAEPATGTSFSVRCTDSASGDFQSVVATGAYGQSPAAVRGACNIPLKQAAPTCVSTDESVARVTSNPATETQCPVRRRRLLSVDDGFEQELAERPASKSSQSGNNKGLGEHAGNVAIGAFKSAALFYCFDLLVRQAVQRVWEANTPTEKTTRQTAQDGIKWLVLGAAVLVGGFSSALMVAPTLCLANSAARMFVPTCMAAVDKKLCVAPEMIRPFFSLNILYVAVSTLSAPNLLLSLLNLMIALLVGGATASVLGAAEQLGSRAFSHPAAP